ncbi:hypothetical protein ACQ9ZG_19340 [Streptomyces araujoniae]|uniref:hypothetical protein n=1 Tax=Streptomyces sp. ZEA17I TaxID=2202516 RepID=UPI00215AE6BC|nr:hypothetical protein [Streptomyces sp. ZEA17I]
MTVRAVGAVGAAPAPRCTSTTPPTASPRPATGAAPASARGTGRRGRTPAASTVEGHVRNKRRRRAEPDVEPDAAADCEELDRRLRTPVNPPEKDG